MIKKSKTTQRIMLGAALVIILSGMAVIICEMNEVFEPPKVFGVMNLGIVMILAGGILTFLAPKPSKGKKKKKYRGY